MIANFFWNSVERRPRAGWRILLYALITFVFLVAINYGIAILIGGVLWLIHPVSIDSLPGQVEALIGSSPWGWVLLQIAIPISMFIALGMAGRWVDHRPWVDFGFHFDRRWWADLGFGLALGALLMTGIFLVERMAGWITVTEVRPLSLRVLDALARGMVMFVVVGIEEELFSRGYLLRNLAEGGNGRVLGARNALLLSYVGSSAVFGLFHLANPNTTWISTVNLIAAGLFLGLGYVLTGELALSIGLHITWNFFQGYIFGLPVSGSAPGTSWIETAWGGPEVWTGGAFGPEAGLIAWGAMAVGCLAIVLWVRATRKRAAFQVRLAEYRRS